MLKGSLVSLPFLVLGLVTVLIVNRTHASWLAADGLAAGFSIAAKAWIGVLAVASMQISSINCESSEAGVWLLLD